MCIKFKLDTTAPESEKCVLCPLYHANKGMQWTMNKNSKDFLACFFSCVPLHALVY